MSRLAEKVVDLPLTDDVEKAVDDVIRLSNGDPRTAVRSLILGQRSLMEAYSGAISAGYVRQGSR
jgi:hypothetical protein